MLLKNKNAIIFGAGGSLGGAVSRALAKAGARVFLSGHHLVPVTKVADEIIKGGGRAETAEVNARDEKAVNDYVHTVVAEAGTIDICFNAIGWQDTQNIALAEMSLKDFTRPISIAMESHFITDTATARVMIKQKSGIILSLTATPGGIGYPHVGGFGPACCAVESFSRDLASELGPHGVRVINIRSGGSPDSRVFKEAIDQGGEKTMEFIKKMEDDTMLKKMPVMQDIANTAVFLASDMAAGITGVTVDVTCGTTSALNYKIPPITFVQRNYS